MAADDIGFLIFSELLGMTEYPGSPFTGNIVKDVVQYLFIPSVFIILVIYILLGRLVVPGNPKLRILIGVSIYLFIITSGYYKIFARLAGPYFIFLIFVLGLLYFIPAHFGIAGSRPTHGGRAFARRSDDEEGRHYVDEDSKVRNLLGIPTLNPVEKKWMETEIRKLKKRLEMQEKIADNAVKVGRDVPNTTAQLINDLQREIQDLEHKIYGRY